MGILGFQKFQTDEVIGGSMKLQMIEAINEWKIKHPEQQPVIVVRIKELVISVIQLNVKAACLGGSHRYYHDQLDKFFKQFQDLNVKFVFFGGGSKDKDKLSKLTSKTDKDYKKYIEILQHVDKTNELKPCSRPEFRMCLGLYEEGIARKYGEYHLSDGNLNKDMVQFARQTDNVIAILAKDSDFLLYNLESVQYWSCGIEHLCFNDMTTMTFSQKAMLEHVKLTPHQFHVAVAIAGVILDDPKKHCERVKRGVFKQRKPGSIQIIECICDCVRKNVPAEKKEPNFGAWTTAMFFSYLEDYSWLIEKQYKKYDVAADKTLNFITEGEGDEDKLLRKYKNIWTILDDGVVRVNHCFIDLSRWTNDRNAMAFHNLFVLVFKRAMGIVLHSKKDQMPKRRFLMKGSERERCTILPKTLIYSSVDVPSIAKLIDENNSDDEEFTTKKWSLLLWVLHKDFDDELIRKIRNLPRDILPVVITVLFLLWEHQITPMESDAIIISENDFIKQSNNEEKVDYPAKFDGRTIRVAHIYVQARVLINRCFQICGIDLFNEHQITPMESDAIIISENDFIKQSNNEEKVDYPAKFDGRTIRVAHIYVQARVLINRCFQICGIDLFNVPVLFDGAHFHNLLDKFVENTEYYEEEKSKIKGFEINAF